MTDELIAQLVLQLPNVAVALWSLYWSFGRLEKMIEVHNQLLNRLLDIVTDPDNQSAWQREASHRDYPIPPLHIEPPDSEP